MQAKKKMVTEVTKTDNKSNKRQDIPLIINNQKYEETYRPQSFP